MSEITKDKSLAQQTLAHYERHLGIPAGSYTKTADGERLHVEVLAFDECPRTGATSFATYGLSRSPLRQRVGPPIRQELLLCVDASLSEQDAVNLLIALAQTVLERELALRLGELIELQRPVGPNQAFRHLISLEPVWFDGLFLLDAVEPPLLVLWAIPLYDGEAAYIDQHGWDRFEDELVRVSPDICDLTRAPVV
jgi:hypothetical protein